MIKFFRNIRKSLLMENKTSKYIKYAIGEIFLVLIGILLALQINSWNNKRLLKKEELNILKDLKFEFVTNISKLDTVISEHEKSYKAAVKLNELFGNRKAFEKMTDTAFQNLMFKMDQNFTYDPQKGILKSIISSGQINNLSNKKLKYLLASIEDDIADAFEDTGKIERWRDNMNTKLYANAFEVKNKKIERFNIRNFYDDPNARGYTFILFVTIRNQGLIEERQLRNKMKLILSLIEKEIQNK